MFHQTWQKRYKNFPCQAKTGAVSHANAEVSQIVQRTTWIKRKEGPEEWVTLVEKEQIEQAILLYMSIFSKLKLLPLGTGISQDSSAQVDSQMPAPIFSKEHFSMLRTRTGSPSQKWRWLFMMELVIPEEMKPRIDNHGSRNIS